MHQGRNHMNRIMRDKKHPYLPFYFLLFIAYNFFVTASMNPMGLSDVCYPYFLVDFSMGFCSKLLPGAIYNFFFDNTSKEAVFAFNTVVFLVFVFIILVLLERLLLRFEGKNRKSIMLLTVFFLTGISTFPMYVYKMGSLDSFWMYFTVLSVLFLADKRLYLLIIPSSLMVIMVNYGSLFVYIPFILLLMIYKITVVQDNKEKSLLWTAAAVTLVSTVLLSGYFVLFEQSNLVYTFEEFSAILTERGFEGVSKYYATGLYSEPYYETIDYEGINSIESPLSRALYFAYQRLLFILKTVNFRNSIAPMLMCLPVVAAVFLCFKAFLKKKNDNRLKKAIIICMSLMFFLSIAACAAFSADVARFTGHSYTLLLTSFFYIMYYERENVADCLSELLSKIPQFIVVIYTLVYAFMVFDPETYI